MVAAAAVFAVAGLKVFFLARVGAVDFVLLLTGVLFFTAAVEGLGFLLGV